MKTALEILTSHLDEKHPHLFYHMDDKSVPSGIINDGDSIFVAITEAMQIYASQFIDAAADNATGFIKGHGIKINRQSILTLKSKLK